MNMDPIKTKMVETAFQSRALIYTLESLPLPMLYELITGQKRTTPDPELQKKIVEKAQALLALDSKEYVELGLPIKDLVEKQPHKHLKRWLKILGDGTLSFWRRRNNKTQVFSSKVKNLDEFPEYYRRNFHHQTDGYFTEESASMYEHQVEILFRGLADPMRRRLLKPLLKKLKNKKKPRILDLACGTGAFTQMIRQALPNAEITAVDISPAYLQHAKKRFANDPNINFLIGKSEDLPFKDQSFDAVVCVFLHHELPRKVREKSLDESLRVCKKSGFWGMVDSIQLGDDEDLDWAISEFPKNFHEPFFTNYIKNSLIDYLSTKHGHRKFKKEIHMLSQVLYSDK